MCSGNAALIVLTLGKKDSATTPTCHKHRHIEGYVSLVDFVITLMVVLVLNRTNRCYRRGGVSSTNQVNTPGVSVGMFSSLTCHFADTEVLGSSKQFSKWHTLSKGSVVHSLDSHFGGFGWPIFNKSSCSLGFQGRGHDFFFFLLVSAQISCCCVLCTSLSFSNG